jgi:chemotaxis protein methyltransferase CheR
MKDNTPDTLLSQLSEFIAAKTALHFPRERWGDLERRAGSAAKEFGFMDMEEFINWIISSSPTKEQIEILASHLTISETYFWREPRVFDALQEKILPKLIHLREKGEKRLRIWSAGCATGEEPYSIAIAILRAIGGLKDWHITILATDINPRILAKAMAGVYGKWSFRSAPAWLKKEYFRPKEDGMFEILPNIRNMATFEYLNLAEDIYPSPLNNTNAMDIIFCRNVLMYFTPERGKKAIENLYRCLMDGGWLIVGASELSQQLFPQFTPVHFQEAICYRKVYQGPRPSEDFWFDDIAAWQAPIRSPLDDVDKVDQSASLMPLGGAELLPDKKDFIFKEAEAANDSKPSVQEDSQYPADRVEECEKEDLSITDFIRALAGQGELTEALALCEKAIADNKLDPEMHYLRAIILQEQNSEVEAIASIKRALYLAPDFVLANFFLGNLLIRRGDRRAGKRYFENVLSLLGKFGQKEILPESEGLTAGRLREIVQATMKIGLNIEY